MRLITLATVACWTLFACAGPQRPPQPPAPEEKAPPSVGASHPASVAASPEAEKPPDEPPTTTGSAFALTGTKTARTAQGVSPSRIKATKTEAAMKIFVIDKDKGPVPGIVVVLTAPDGTKYYTEETDALGYTEVLVPIARTYELVFLSLGRKDIAATVEVADEPNQNVKLTLRYKRHNLPAPEEPSDRPKPGLVLQGVNFDTGKASLRPESFAQLDGVVEYMAHKKSARIEISGHTDNVGNPKTNKALSEKRAEACRDYLVSKGIAPDRIEAVGVGDEQPIAPNDSEEGRQKNRRIEAKEL